MALTDQEIKAWLINYVNTNPPGWGWDEWNAETYYLGLHHKFDNQLTAAQAGYTDKLREIYQTYKAIRGILESSVPGTFIETTSEDILPDLKNIKQKVMRIARKFRGVNAEVTGREAGKFGPGLEYDRTYVGTVYYIDLDAGNNGNTGLDAAGEEWLTLEQYTTTTVRSAGDIAYVRANTDEVPGGIIVFDESGTATSRIKIIGCDSVTNDPWSDSSDVDPIIDFNSNNYYLNFTSDSYWHIENLEVKNGSTYNVFAQSANPLFLVDCVIKDGGNRGLNPTSSHVCVDGCTITGNASYGVLPDKSFIEITNTTIDGVDGQGTGLQASNSMVWISDSTIGTSTAHSTKDINLSTYSQCRLRDVELGSAGISVATRAVILSEDDDAIIGAHLTTMPNGTITKDTSVVRSGGASSSAKMLTGSTAGVNYPVRLSGFFGFSTPFNIWCAAASTTVTVYMRTCGTWGTYPTAAQLYLEAKYLDEASTSASRATVVSNDVLSHASNWVAFDVAFTPAQAGWVYLDVVLGLYEDAGDGCYVDVKPIVT